MLLVPKFFSLPFHSKICDENQIGPLNILKAVKSKSIFIPFSKIETNGNHFENDHKMNEKKNNDEE